MQLCIYFQVKHCLAFQDNTNRLSLFLYFIATQTITPDSHFHIQNAFRRTVNWQLAYPYIKQHHIRISRTDAERTVQGLPNQISVVANGVQVPVVDPLHHSKSCVLQFCVARYKFLTTLISHHSPCSQALVRERRRSPCTRAWERGYITQSYNGNYHKVVAIFIVQYE